MDEIRAGVITDTAALHGNRLVSQITQFDVRQAHIDRPAQQVLAVRGDAA